MSKNQYRSAQLEKKKKNLLRLKIALWVIASAILLYGIVFSFNHPNFSIKQISVAPTTFAPHDEILARAENVLNGSYFGIFSKRNFIFVPIGALRYSITSLHPAIEEVSVHRTSAHDVSIDVKEFEPVAKWCGADARKKIASCYIINKKGQFFAQETTINTFAVPTFFGEITQENIIGSYYAPIETFEKVMEFVRGLPQFNIMIEAVETEDFETFVVRTVKGPYLMLDKNDDIDIILDNLRIVIEQEEINKAQFKNLIYIDLRHGNKVFYKIGVPAV